MIKLIYVMVLTTIVIILMFFVSCLSSSPERPYCPKVNLEDKDKTINTLIDCIEDYDNYIDYFVK